jgi:hypothetical protein
VITLKALFDELYQFDSAVSIRTCVSRELDAMILSRKNIEPNGWKGGENSRLNR